jgi:hypothetical protein
MGEGVGVNPYRGIATPANGLLAVALAYIAATQTTTGDQHGCVVRNRRTSITRTHASSDAAIHPYKAEGQRS